MYLKLCIACISCSHEVHFDLSGDLRGWFGPESSPFMKKLCRISEFPTHFTSRVAVKMEIDVLQI